MNGKCGKIKSQCVHQNQLFRKWRQQLSFRTFHHQHYDWWAFPIDELSSHGRDYQLDPSDISLLILDQQFIEALRSNAILVCESWGYQLLQGEPIKFQLDSHQKWQNWPIRLYKMTKSLDIFKQFDLLKNALKFGRGLIKSGWKFVYGKKNLALLYELKIQEKQQGSSKEQKMEMKGSEEWKEMKAKK